LEIWCDHSGVIVGRQGRLVMPAVLRGRSDPGDPDRAGQLELDDGGFERHRVTRGKRAVN